MTLRTAVAHLLEQPTKNELEQLYKFRPVYRKLVDQLQAKIRSSRETQAAFDVGQFVVLRDDPNGEVFTVLSVQDDSVFLVERGGAYEDTLLQVYTPVSRIGRMYP